MCTIINLSEYRHSSFVKTQANNCALKEYHSTESMQYKLNETADLFLLFNKDKKQLLSSLQKNRTKYKYPTIISKYRKSTDVFAGIYLLVQEALFKYDDQTLTHKWALGLFRDKEFSKNIQEKIQKDIILIKQFIIKYVGCEQESIKSYLKELIVTKELYSHYVDIFNSLNDMTGY